MLRWLIERRGHYSHVVYAEDELPALLRAVLRRTQRQAHFMTVEELETSAGALVSPQRPDDLAAEPQGRR